MGTPAQADLRQEDLIDTNILIDILNEYPSSRSLEQSCQSERACVSIVSLAEVWAGTGEEDAEWASDFLSGFRALSADALIARHAGKYLHVYGRTHGVELPDALIAATAKVHGLRLVTRDRKHFPMKDIDVWVPY